MTEYRHILYEKRSAVARVILNRPRFRNAQSHVLLDEMDDAFQDAADDDEIRVIILSGAGEHFSSGHHGYDRITAILRLEECSVPQAPDAL